MLSKFFIERQIFATVMALLILLAGILKRSGSGGGFAFKSFGRRMERAGF